MPDAATPCLILPRRRLLRAVAAMPLALALPARAQTDLQRLEEAADGRLGVYAATLEGRVLAAYRAGERFPMCSTFKAVLAAAILDKAAHTPGLLERRIRYGKEDLVPWAPITEKHLDEGMTVAALCDATVRYSDNPAANLLLRLIDGPAGLTRWMRAQGDDDFRLDRWETELNAAIPGDPRDTTTPRAMGNSLARLTLGDALRPAARAQLQDWLKRNTTGDTRIRAGVPAGWVVGDKTGTGAYGATNDIAIVWPAERAPFALAVYFTTTREFAKPRNDVIAEATRLVIGALG